MVRRLSGTREVHIEYFQSLEKFHEDGLPGELPAHLEEELIQDPRLREPEAELQALMAIMGGSGEAPPSVSRWRTVGNSSGTPCSYISPG